MLLALLLLGSSVAFAQSGAASAPTPSPALGAAPADSGAVLVFNNWYLPRYRATATSGADTTGALLSLFRKRRTAGYLFLIPYAVGASLALPIATTDTYGQRHVASEAISPPLGITILAATVAGFVAHANKFNKNHLLAVDRAYYAGQPVPAKYRRLLKPRHFADAAYLREALNQQMAREKMTAQ
ncbi:hypothetical protein BEN49_02640 [Hymenobacter coccineus]|uniref:Uncharacterized protein n=1 Tax=Hymenobacter coccineus TaxID=1908235 RepID=A0A1G1SVY7_9BACT|nr:hypothetical protein BEN49_02640 [Hymenobacter coccineus]